MTVDMKLQGPKVQPLVDEGLGALSTGRNDLSHLGLTESGMNSRTSSPMPVTENGPVRFHIAPSLAEAVDGKTPNFGPELVDTKSRPSYGQVRGAAFTQTSPEDLSNEVDRHIASGGPKANVLLIGKDGKVTGNFMAYKEQLPAHANN